MFLSSSRTARIVDAAKEHATDSTILCNRSLFIVAIIIGYGGVFDSDPFKTEAINFANKKVVSRRSSNVPPPNTQLNSLHAPGHPRMAPNLPARHRRQLAGMHGVFPGLHGA